MTTHYVTLQDVVQRQLAEGLRPLEGLPAEVAGLVMEDMRAAAVRRVTALEAEADLITPSAILLPDGSSAGLDWQVNRYIVYPTPRPLKCSRLMRTPSRPPRYCFLTAPLLALTGR